MKKIFFTLCFIITSLCTLAQPITYGLTGGANFAKLTVNEQGSISSANTPSKTSFSIGSYISYNFGNLSLRPTFLFTGKGGNLPDVGGAINIYYLEVPIDVVYHFPIPGEKGTNIYIGAGPYISFGIAGTESVTGVGSANISFGSDPNSDQYKTIDYGANIVAGIKFKNGLFLEVNYDKGLTNVSATTPTDGIEQKNSVFGVSIGFTY